MFSLPILIHYHMYARKKEIVPLSLFTLRSGGDCGFVGKECALLLKPKAGANGKRGMGDVASHPYLLLPPFSPRPSYPGGGDSRQHPPSFRPISFAPCPGFILGKREEEATPFAYPNVGSIPFVLLPLLNLMVKTEKELI